MLSPEPVRLHALQQLPLGATLQRGRFVQGDQQGAQLEAPQVFAAAVGCLCVPQAGLGFGQVDGRGIAFALIVVLPGQQARQSCQRGEGTEQLWAFTVGEMKGIAQGQ
ncbi:hypothetical protein D9M68_964010 [compost metagenome]